MPIAHRIYRADRTTDQTKNGERDTLAMFNGIGPQSTGRSTATESIGPVEHSAVEKGAAEKGRTSDYRDVSVVSADPSHNGARQRQSSTRQLKRRTIRPVHVKDDTMGPGSVLWQPTSRQAPHPSTRPLSEEQCAGLPKRKFIDRFMALAVCMVLDLSAVRQKFVSYTSATFYAIKGQLQKLQQLLKLGDSLSDDERAKSKELVKNLRRSVKEAKQAKLDEAHNYIQLVKALKKINRGEIGSHKVHLAGMELAGGKASLEDIDMTVTGVDVVSSTSGALVPKLKADLKATLVVAVPGKDPIRVSVDIEGAELTLEGRVMPFVNSYIQGNTVSNLFKNIRHFRQNREGKFELSHLGLSAEKVSATLGDIDPGAVSRIAARSVYGNRRVIEQLIADLKLPVDFQVNKLELFDQGQKHPMLKAEDLSGRVKCRQGDEIKEGEKETRGFSLQTGNVYCDTQQASDLASRTLQKMVQVPMTAMPGDAPVTSTASGILSKHSERFRANIARAEINFNLDCIHDKHSCKALGTEKLDIWADQLEAFNEGATDLDLGASEVHVCVERQGSDRSVTTRLHDFMADVDLREELPDKELKLDLHGRVQGLGAELSVIKKDGKTHYQSELEQVDIKTTPEAMTITKGSMEVSLPGSGSLSFGSVVMESQAQKAGRDNNVTMDGLKGKGAGDIRVKSSGNEWRVPVRGSGSVEALDLAVQQNTGGVQDVPETLAYAQLQTLKLNDLGIAGGRLGEVVVDLDDQGSGTIRLNRVELDGSELLNNIELLPEVYRQWITPALLEGRMFRCDISLKVMNGEILTDQSQVSGLDIQHTKEAGKTMMGQAAGYLLGMLQGLVNRLDVSAVNVHEGRLWLELNIKGWHLPVPLFRVASEHINEKGGISVSGLLHENTGVQLMDMSNNYRELLHSVNTGTKGSLQTLEETCRLARKQEAVNILQRVDISSIQEQARTGNPEVVAGLPELYRLFVQYPETVNRALQIREFIQSPAESLDTFSAEPYARLVDPVLLFQNLQREGEKEKALTVMEQALEQTPYNPRLNYFAARLLSDQTDTSSEPPPLKGSSNEPKFSG
ncbi:hypothetical protein [Endozoicomonas euniceicola]|uniref:Uncharacterized protein n=1 Tax=Endozoicomonas euniceicola TaxID=1234143 RepID=A0ABY6GWS7_9GAMM|nr:hypothetical protein [Endozoicomonas euniceicola]UYM17225.1 hypothetical protein NX720_04685 [Endozoicomonas euniceicola]